MILNDIKKCIKVWRIEVFRLRSFSKLKLWNMNEKREFNKNNTSKK